MSRSLENSEYQPEKDLVGLLEVIAEDWRSYEPSSEDLRKFESCIDRIRHIL